MPRPGGTLTGDYLHETCTGVACKGGGKPPCPSIEAYQATGCEPSTSRTRERFKLAGTDLGVPVRHRRASDPAGAPATFLLFGDTFGRIVSTCNPYEVALLRLVLREGPVR